MPKKVKRLFEQFKPETYDLTLDINEDKLTLSGQVKITGYKTGRPSNRLTFHQKGLKITNVEAVKLDKSGQHKISIERINSQASFDEVRLHAKDKLYPGQYIVLLKFQGKISQAMHGIYPCYFKHKGKDKKLIASQFESHHAREAFPCIDEPEAKSIFKLTLVTEKGSVVIGNTPVQSQGIKNKRLVTTFETSPVMSAYLLAFVSGEMHGVSAKTKNGIPVSSWASVAQPKEHLKYANQETVNILEFFIDYFKTPFPLKKLDNVAVPDFEAAAMENWGLITYREMALLADPINRSLTSEQLITLIIAHEVSHQWFGDLVTMKWWDDLWLNESFASIMENVAPDHLHPDWQQWESFAIGRVLSSSHRDIYKDVQPVGVEVKHPDEISSLFDPSIVYAKGARLLCMLREYIGEDDFRNGLRNYFKKHAYKNTARDDLWKSLETADKSNIDKLMTPWIKQSGQPLLRVKLDGDKLHLSQKRFLMDGQDNKSLWPIPLLANVPLPINLLDKSEIEIKYEGTTPPLFNVSGNGHYIVAYEDQSAKDDLYRKIINRSVNSISRITILNDMFMLARAGEYDLTALVDLVYKCSNEPRDAVWSMFLRLVSQAKTLTDGDVETEKDIKAYKAKLGSYWYKKLGWEDKKNDEPNTKHLRTTALALSIVGENQAVLKTALQKYNKAKSVADLPAEQRAIITGAAVRHGPPTVISKLMKEYVSSPNPEVQQAITTALTSTRDPKVVSRLIKWGLKEGGAVRPQDIDHWYAYFMSNPYARPYAWQWLTESWDYLSKIFGSGKSMEYYVWYSSGPLSTPSWQAKFKEFFEPKLKMPSLKRNILIAFSEIEARVAWREREENKLRSYFKNLN